jgi:hypothetical protein
MLCGEACFAVCPKNLLRLAADHRGQARRIQSNWSGDTLVPMSAKHEKEVSPEEQAMGTRVSPLRGHKSGVGLGWALPDAFYGLLKSVERPQYTDIIYSTVPFDFI